MAKHIYQQSVFSANDAVSVAPYASVAVTLAGGGACVIWSDEAGTSVISGSVLLADEFGFFSFYANIGKYDIAITSGSITKTLQDVEIGSDDREYVDGAISAAVAAHSGATDPHGDRAYADSLVIGLWDDRGNFDASVNAFPSAGGSGTDGAILKGDIWTVSVSGTLPTSQTVDPGDTVRALINTPGNTASNWAIQARSIGYVPENVANKSTSGALGTSDTLYPTQKATKEYVDSAAPSPFYGYQRITKFGNHLQLDATTPNCPYKLITPSTHATVDVASFLALANRGNITDVSLWYINSVNSGVAASLQLYKKTTAGIAVSQQWLTGSRLQMLASVALCGPLPSVAASTNVTYRLGFANPTDSSLQLANPFAGTASGTGNEYTGCAAYFAADVNSTYWQCISGQKTNTQTTVTSIPVATDTFFTARIIVTETGSVEFYFNGTLVATHSGLGVIPNGAFISEAMATRNVAATSSSYYQKGFYVDEIDVRMTLPSGRTGLVFT